MNTRANWFVVAGRFAECVAGRPRDEPIRVRFEVQPFFGVGDGGYRAAVWVNPESSRVAPLSLYPSVRSLIPRSDL